MPSNAVAMPLGPFYGGLNTISDPTAIADNELWDCVNLEVESDGSLVCRPPVTMHNGDSSWTDHVNIIGSATVSGISYIFASNSQGTYYSTDGSNWIIVKLGLLSYSAVQIRNLVYIVAAPLSAQSGGFWTPGGFGTWTVDNNMPRGEKGIFHKGRMWIIPGFSATNNHSRLQFTQPIDANTLNWLSTNIIDVQPGDGQYLVDIVVYDDNLLLFKSDSCYVYSFDLQPNDGSVQTVNPNIGASSRDCVVLYENTVFVFHQERVYQVVDYAFNRVSEKLDVIFDGASPSPRVENVFLTLVGDRLILRYFNSIYCLGLRTGTWSRWSFKDAVLRNFGPFLKMPTATVVSGQHTYYAGSSIGSVTKIFVILDNFDGVQTEDIDCYIKTKIYNETAILSNVITDSVHYKKMAWWGANVQGNGIVTARANPLVASYRVKWADVTNIIWPSSDQFKWDDPLTIPFAPVSTVEPSGKIRRDFLRFKKTLRFHQIYFELTMNTDGSLNTGPCRIFGLTAMLSSRQTVSKQVT